MAFAWPVDLDTYLFEGGPAKVFMRRWRLSESSRVSGSMGGSNWAVGRGTRLWYGSIQIVPQRIKDQQQLEARMELLASPGATFLIRDFMADPLVGTIGSPILSGVAANNSDISISGLTAGLKVPAGTPLGFTTAGGVRHHHRTLTTFTATSGGLGNVQVVPALRPGYVVGTTAIQLVRPKLKATMVPASLEMGEADSLNSGPISFDWIQTLGSN